MVADQHRLPDLHALAQATGRVGQHHRLHPGRGGGPHVLHHPADALALVQVGAPEQHERAPALDVHRPHGAAVADRLGLLEPRQLVQRDLRVTPAEDVRRGPPARAEDHRDVVLGVAGALGDGGRRRPGQVLFTHAVSLGQPVMVNVGTMRSYSSLFALTSCSVGTVTLTAHRLVLWRNTSTNVVRLICAGLPLLPLSNVR